MGEGRRTVGTPKAEQFGLDRGGESEYLIAQSFAWNL